MPARSGFIESSCRRKNFFSVTGVGRTSATEKEEVSMGLDLETRITRLLDELEDDDLSKEEEAALYRKLEYLRAMQS